MKVQALLAAAMLIGACALVSGAAAMQAQPVSTNADYQVFCASCHGAEGHGDGIVAKSLKKRPADLTQLALKNNGVFPADRVFKTVEGLQPDPAHVLQDMPAWGDVFAKSSDSAGAENAAARIGGLVRYLETLQAK